MEKQMNRKRQLNEREQLKSLRKALLVTHEFGEWVQPLFTTILKNCAQNVKLAELRDTLLPKLMSGELDVSDIEL